VYKCNKSKHSIQTPSIVTLNRDRIKHEWVKEGERIKGNFSLISIVTLLILIMNIHRLCRKELETLITRRTMTVENRSLTPKVKICRATLYVLLLTDTFCLGKLVVVQMVKSSPPTSFGTQRLITMFTRVSHWNLSCATLIQSTPHTLLQYDTLQRCSDIHTSVSKPSLPFREYQKC
jgi:hypothetical protein